LELLEREYVVGRAVQLQRDRAFHNLYSTGSLCQQGGTLKSERHFPPPPEGRGLHVERAR
jgi:hypothetical protein